MSAGASGNRNDELEDFWEEELQRRPEVRIINKYAVIMAYIRLGLKGIGTLALLWATVVLLGGFVSDLTKQDFKDLTIIVFLQAAGLFDAMADDRFAFYGELLASLKWDVKTSEEKRHERTHFPGGQRLKTKIRIIVSKIIKLAVFIVLSPAAVFTLGGPIICVILSAGRVAKQDYGIANDDASKANLKPALNLFYYVSLAHGALCILYIFVEVAVDEWLVKIIGQQNGLSTEVLDGYLQETKKMCVNNPASTDSWNLITYGAGLLDSQSPEDYAAGGRVLTMLIDQDIPVPITWLLIRSPRQRIQKLIGTLAWRSPAEREMRWFAARIVEHLAGHLNLAHYPGALECISSLFDTSCHNNVDQEALHLPFVIGRSKSRKRKSFLTEFFVRKPEDNSSSMVLSILVLKKSSALENDGTLEQDNKQMANGEGIDEDLVLPGLRILENLAHDRHNCTLIYNTKDLLSRVVAPVSSNKLVQDIKSNTAWAKVVDGSLKVVSRLMGSAGSTGEEMRSLIANDNNTIKNLETVLDMDMKINSSIIELQMRAIEVLTQLALHQPTSTSAEKLIERTLNIFFTADWMEDYLKDEKNKIDKPTTNQQNTLSKPSMGTCMNDCVNKVSGAETREKERVEKKMKDVKETATRLKEKAGEALAMLSSSSEVIKMAMMSSDSKSIKSFAGCEDYVHRLTELLNSEINTGCRISAAIILKNLSDHVREPTLLKVLEELLPIQAKALSKPRSWEIVICCIPLGRNGIENPSYGAQAELSALRSHIQQCGERRLRAELLSLVAAIRASGHVNFAAALTSQTQPFALEEFVARLKKMVEDNMYATPACLAIQKLTCEMVIKFIPHDRNVEVIEKHDIVGTLVKASKTMARLESSMLFARVDRDCHGIDLRPLFSDLAKEAEDLLTHRKLELDINTVHADVP